MTTLNNKTVNLTVHAKERLQERFNVAIKGDRVRMPATLRSDEYICHRVDMKMEIHFVGNKANPKNPMMFVYNVEQNVVVTVYQSGPYYDKQLANAKRVAQRMAA